MREPAVEQTGAAGHASALGTPDAPDEPATSILGQQPAVVIHGHRQRLWDYRGLIRSLAVRNMRARYSHSLLGVYWALLNPLITATVLSVVFGVMLRIISPEIPFVVFIFSGLVLWNVFSNSVTDATGSVTDYAMLMGRVRFPREVLPLATVVARLLDLGFSLIVLAIFMAVLGVPTSLTALWAIPIIVILLAFTTGISLAVAALNAIYRDVAQITGLTLMLWFYLTPIVYSLEQVPEPYRSWLLLNPLAPLVQGFRGAVALGRAPDPAQLLLSAALSLLVLALGAWTFKRIEPAFAELL